MYKFIAIFFMLLFSYASHAQLKLGLYGTVAKPIGDFGDVPNPGPGVGITLKNLSSNRHFQFGVDLGYLVFQSSGKLIGPYGTAQINLKYRVIPVKVGVEYFILTDKFRPYFGFDVGIYFSNFQIQKSVVDTWEAFGVAPGVGLAIDLTPRTELNFNMRYNVMFDGGNDSVTGLRNEHGKFVAFNVGIAFSLNSK